MDAKVHSTDLFKYALLNPILTRNGLDTLRIVSGYASHALASWHLATLKAKRRRINVELIIGMAGGDRINKLDHAGFVSLHNKEEFTYDGEFNCSYVKMPRLIHSKVYVWCKGDTPVLAFIGSANYSNNGFKSSNRIETLAECDPISANEFFIEARKNSVSCLVANKKLFVTGYNIVPGKEHAPVVKVEKNRQSPFFGCSYIDINLKNSRNHFGVGSGLNWGLNKNGKPRLQNKKKPKGGRRDPNEAYIRVPKRFDVGFFPKYIKVPRGVKARDAQIPFSVQTDDGKVFSCIRASGGYGKEIETPQDNTELGRWFRERLNIPYGTMITQKVMRRYGRDFVRFYKLAEDQYYMDFSRIEKG